MLVCVYTVTRVYIRDAFNKFPYFFVQAFKIVILNIQYVIAIHLIRWLTTFYDFSFKWTATAAIGIHPTKAWLSQLVNFKNAIFTWGHFTRTICNKILCVNLEKMLLKPMECFRLLFDHLAWIEHQFLSGIRDSRKAGSLWGIWRGVGGVRKSIQKSWLAKGLGLGLGLLCWGFKEVFFKSSQWHLQQDNAPVHNSILVKDYLTKMGINTVPRPPYSPHLALCDFWLFPKRLSLWDNWGDERGCDVGH